MDNLEDIRAILEDRKNALAERIRAVKADLSQQRPADFSEQVTERENEDVLRAIQGEAEKELAAVNRALQKITAGEYGLCDRCGKDISPGRLKVLPFTSLCVDCASE